MCCSWKPGRQVDFEAEVRSLEWPYDHPRRGKLSPDTYVLDESDYKRLKPPYAQSFGRYTNVMSWQQLGEGPDYTKQFFVNEKEHPYTGTNFSWVRSRVLGGKTNVWGRLALRLSDYDFKAASRDGYRRRLADLLRRRRSLLRQGRPSARHFRRDGKPAVAAGFDLPAADAPQPGRGAYARPC